MSTLHYISKAEEEGVMTSTECNVAADAWKATEKFRIEGKAKERVAQFRKIMANHFGPKRSQEIYQWLVQRQNEARAQQGGDAPAIPGHGGPAIGNSSYPQPQPHQQQFHQYQQQQQQQQQPFMPAYQQSPPPNNAPPVYQMPPIQQLPMPNHPNLALYGSPPQQHQHQQQQQQQHLSRSQPGGGVGIMPANPTSHPFAGQPLLPQSQQLPGVSQLQSRLSSSMPMPIQMPMPVPVPGIGGPMPFTAGSAAQPRFLSGGNSLPMTGHRTGIIRSASAQQQQQQRYHGQLHGVPAGPRAVIGPRSNTPGALPISGRGPGRGGSNIQMATKRLATLKQVPRSASKQEESATATAGSEAEALVATTAEEINADDSTSLAPNTNNSKNAGPKPPVKTTGAPRRSKAPRKPKAPTNATSTSSGSASGEGTRVVDGSVEDPSGAMSADIPADASVPDAGTPRPQAQPKTGVKRKARESTGSADGGASGEPKAKKERPPSASRSSPKPKKAPTAAQNPATVDGADASGGSAGTSNVNGKKKDPSAAAATAAAVKKIKEKVKRSGKGKPVGSAASNKPPSASSLLAAEWGLEGSRGPEGDALTALSTAEVDRQLEISKGFLHRMFGVYSDIEPTISANGGDNNDQPRTAEQEPQHAPAAIEEYWRDWRTGNVMDLQAMNEISDIALGTASNNASGTFTLKCLELVSQAIEGHIRSIVELSVTSSRRRTNQSAAKIFDSVERSFAEDAVSNEAQLTSDHRSHSNSSSHSHSNNNSAGLIGLARCRSNVALRCGPDVRGALNNEDAAFRRAIQDYDVVEEERMHRELKDYEDQRMKGTKVAKPKAPSAAAVEESELGWSHELSAEEEGLLSWKDIAKLHFRLGVAKKFDISLTGYKKRGRTSKAGIERAQQVEKEAEATKEAALKVRLAGFEGDTYVAGIATSTAGVDDSMDVVVTTEERPGDRLPDSEGQTGLRTIAAISTAGSTGVEISSSCHSCPYPLVTRGNVKPVDVVRVLSEVARAKAGGSLSRAVGKSLQYYKVYE